MAKTESYGWQRCRIVRLHTKNVCTVFLLDVGRYEYIRWMDLRKLDEKWCHRRPFANRCALISLASASPIDRVTRLQQQQFENTLQAHEIFYIFVNRAGTISSDIYLYYKLNDEFRCVNMIFPSGVSSTDDDDDFDETIGGKMGPPSHASDKIRSGSGRGAGGRASGAGNALTCRTNSTFNIMTERSAKHSKSAATEISKSDQNERPRPDIEMNEPSEHDVANPVDYERLSKPETVFIRHIDENATIYVCFQRYTSVLNMLRFEISKQIQEGVECDGNTKSADNLVWNVGDHCLVEGTFDGFTEWLRGKLTHISITTDGETLARVRLRDVGKSVETACSTLKAIQNDPKDSIRAVRDFTWKTQLALIKMRHRDASTAAKVLELLNGYNEIVMSVLNSSDDQLNVILWGIKRDIRALLPERIELININEQLVKEGYAVAHTSASTFDRINNCIAESMNVSANTPTTHPTSCYDSGDCLMRSTNYVVDDHQMDVEQWLPSEPIYQREFPAFPMHVTHNLILYVLEANRKTNADKMKEICEKKFKSNELVRRDAVDWKKGDPCFARFEYDGRFYRGSVRRVNFAKGFCMVSKNN